MNALFHAYLHVCAFALALIAANGSHSLCQAFVQPTPKSNRFRTIGPVLNMAEGDGTETDSVATKMSLEEKMQSWEASEEEIKAASLGGMTPGGRGGGADGFDIGLWIMFPFIVATSDKIDVSSVGPPPTV